MRYPLLSVVENELLLERMRSVLKAQEPNAVISEFLSLIKNGTHQKALLYGCKECKPQDANLFRMIAILLWHAPQTELDLNKKDEQSIAAIQHCYTNQNSDLLKLLIGWGASTEEIDAGHEHDIYSRLTTPIKAKINSSLTPDFSKLSNQLNALFLSPALPDKNDINTDKENELYDSARLMFINRTINFIHSHLKSDAPSSIIKFHPLPAEAMELHNFKLSVLKLALFRIAKTAANLSGALRSYYSKCFQPVPFSWTTLEQLSFFELLYDGTVNSVIEVPTKEWQLDEESRYIGANFLKKGWDILYLSDRFIPLILNDLNSLKDFFNTMSQQIQMNERVLIEPIQLQSIKAMTSYIENNRSLAQLVQLTSFQTSATSLKELAEVKAEDAAASSSMPARDVVKPKIMTLMEKHALLRTLQYIGDFTNGKKLSSAFYKLDPSVDWRALIIIRDAIAHQDERDYKYQIDSLLNDPEMFEGIINEARDLHKRIAALIIKQEKRIGIYYGDAEEFCERVLRLENEEHEPIPEAAPPVFQPLVTQEEQKLFIQKLTAANIDARNPNKLDQVNLDKLIDDCTLLFTTEKEISKPVFGAMLKPIAYLRKIGADEKLLYGKLKTILDKANTPQKLDYKEVIEQQQAAANLREKEKDNKLVGLKLIRQLSKNLLQDPQNEHLLTMLKRVDAALEATDNMCQFLFECGYFHKDQSDLITVEQWDAFNQKEGRLTLVNHLKSNDVLNNAMEYNFGQLLQHLDRIRTCKKSPLSPLISSNYEQLRALRNYIEHGSHFYDFARFVTSNNKAIGARYNIICKGLNYVVELRKYLHELKDVLTKESIVKEDSAEQKESLSPASRAGVLRLSIFVPIPCARPRLEFFEEEQEQSSPK
ncbi:MAG: hypothetical protein P4L65_08920 [Legionella sp.]|nr:hypothetical protein [Legionella sp.]